MQGETAQFRIAFDHALELEGGFSNHPHDAGGKTIYGVASASWPTWYTHIMEAYTRGDKAEALARARRFYFEEIWRARPFDRIQHAGLRVTAFDLHVNHTFRTGGLIIQRACNCLIHGLRYEPLEEDGWMGPKSVTRINALAGRYEESVIGAIAGERWRHYRAVIAARPENASFARGWAKRVLPPRLQ